jgi:hypothetical protein
MHASNECSARLTDLLTCVRAPPRKSRRRSEARAVNGHRHIRASVRVAAAQGGRRYACAAAVGSGADVEAGVAGPAGARSSEAGARVKGAWARTE